MRKLSEKEITGVWWRCAVGYFFVENFLRFSRDNFLAGTPPRWFAAIVVIVYFGATLICSRIIMARVLNQQLPLLRADGQNDDTNRPIS